MIESLLLAILCLLPCVGVVLTFPYLARFTKLKLNFTCDNGNRDYGSLAVTSPHFAVFKREMTLSLPPLNSLLLLWLHSTFGK
jgi:hypothetical protein